LFREPGEKNAHIRVASSRESRQVPQCAYDVSIKTRERISFVSTGLQRVSLPCRAPSCLARGPYRAATEAFPNWKIVTRCAPRRTRGFRGRLRPPLEGSAGHPPGGSGRAFPRVPTAQAGSNPAPVRISVRAVRGRRRQSRRSSARASNFLRASSRKCRRRPEESSRHANLGTTDGRARRKEISRGLNARGTHRGHVERFQDVEVLLRGVVLGFGVCGSRGCQPIVEVGIGWGNFLFDKHPDETHARVRTGSSDRFSLGLAFRDAATALCRLERVGDLRGGHGSRASSRKRDED
jgi:hypothetical protein